MLFQREIRGVFLALAGAAILFVPRIICLPRMRGWPGVYHYHTWGGLGSGSIEFLTHSENGPIIISQELIESVLFMFESSMCFLAYRKKLN